MRATGIVRRIDDLGRVVIPKELRRHMGIVEGDPLEIFTTNEGQVILKKYHENEPEKNGLVVEPSAEEEGIKVTLKPYDGEKAFLTLSKSAYDLLRYLEDCGYLDDDIRITKGHDLEIVDFLEKGD